MTENNPPIQTNQNINPPATSSNNPMGYVILSLVIAGLAGTVGYLMGQKNPAVQPNPQTVTETNNQEVSPTSEIIPTVVQSPVPSLQTFADHFTYTSNKFGISFDYANVWAGSTEKLDVGVTEIGDKIYVGPKQYKPETGQSIEVFTKDPADSLETAITKKFLSSVSKTDCYVKTKTGTGSFVGFQTATIGYPVPTGTDQPPFMFGEKCPEMYKESNGMAWFMMDPKYPATYIYVSIGQSPGPASSTAPKAEEWFKTIKILK
jgi:hypothetical protein